MSFSTYDMQTILCVISSVTLICTITVLILVCCYYGNQKNCNTFPSGTEVVTVTPERELVINLLSGVNFGPEMVFGSRRMGVVTTEDDTPAKVVSWTPNKSSGFSIKVQVVARATVNGESVHTDVTSWIIYLVGSRGADGVTQIPNIVDNIRQCTKIENSTNLEQPYLEIDAATQELVVMVKGKSGYIVNFGGDVEILESTKYKESPRP